jgi:GH24 family phage-related lysozyme (muramidase)
MPINFSATLNSFTYLQRLKAFIKVVEGEAFTPYVDITGNPTIGWGFAINDKHIATKLVYTNIIETVLGINRQTKGLSNAALENEKNYEKSLINTLNKSWPADLKSAGSGLTFYINSRR